MSPAFRLEQIYKRFPGVVALDHIDFAVNAGEVRALLGKNGAGKSTLIKVLSGAVQQDAGTIFVDEKPISIKSTRDAFAQGIYTVYQEMSLVPELSVAENILLGRWPTIAGSVVNSGRLKRVARTALERLKVDIALEMPVSKLDVAQQQIVEIAKALSFEPRVLILDEPTSALAANEVEILHHIVREVAKQGHAVIYVTHRLQEVPLVADSVTVLRDGKVVDTVPVTEATPERIAQMMIGFDWQRTHREERHADLGEVRLAVQGLTRHGVLEDVSFEVRAGEVVGIAGLLGSGRTELLRALFGLDAIDRGEIYIGGQRVRHPSPARMKRLQVALTPEDRKRQGLILIASVKNNLTLASLNRLSLVGILALGKMRRQAQHMVQEMSIKVSGLETEVRTLSGGNQQKVVIGNWLNNSPRCPADGRANPWH
ncbi:MAG: sugar ABC transporter ATP-binding protein [Anaerolineae bacterium]|nr:sugar ABC transporter ATP-binding protein [Anaerolineae bacterium]